MPPDFIGGAFLNIQHLISSVPAARDHRSDQHQLGKSGGLALTLSKLVIQIYATLRDIANTGIVSQSTCQVFFRRHVPGFLNLAIGREIKRRKIFNDVDDRIKFINRLGELYADAKTPIYA